MYLVLWLIFSWLIFEMIRDVSTSTLLTTRSFTEFDKLSVDLRFREVAPLPCKFPSVGLHLVAVSIRTCLLKPRLSQDLLCRVSFVGRYVVKLSGHPRPSRGRAPVYRGCPAWTHGCVTESKMTLWQRGNPCVCWLES